MPPSEAAISCFPATGDIHFLAAAKDANSAGTFCRKLQTSSSPVFKEEVLLFNI